MRLFALCLSALIIVGCASTAPTVAQVTGPQSWGSADNVMHIENLYFSEQPDQAGLQAARANGITTIVNLRGPQELDWDESAIVNDAGMRYINIPISGRSDTLDPNVMQQISTTIESLAGENVLVHCASGNRAAAWYATHLVDRRGMSESQATSIAESVGLTSDGMKQRLHNFFSSPSPSDF